MLEKLQAAATERWPLNAERKKEDNDKNGQLPLQPPPWVAPKRFTVHKCPYILCSHINVPIFVYLPRLYIYKPEIESFPSQH